MTVTEDAVRKIVSRLKQEPGSEKQFRTDAAKRREYMETLLDTECGAEANGPMIRFDLGCAQAVVPYAQIETAVLEALDE